MVLLTSCAPLPQPSPIPDAVPIVHALFAGEVELRVARSYRLADPIEIAVELRASDGKLRGPLSARVVASGISGELPVRELVVDVVSVASGARASTMVRWDGNDAAGLRVPVDDYGLVLEFASVTSGGERIERVGSILHVRTF